jgi:manganese efflux pump family protein
VLVALSLSALAVSLGNFAAAVAIGLVGVDARTRARVVIVFGFFETTMPVIGLILGHAFAVGIGSQARLVGGVVLCGAGGHASFTSLRRRQPAYYQPRLARLIIVSAALGIDNLVVGFGLGAYRVSVITAALVMAGVSVFVALAGLEVGSRAGARLSSTSELLSGLMLLVAGVAIGSGAL